MFFLLIFYFAILLKIFIIIRINYYYNESMIEGEKIRKDI